MKNWKNLCLCLAAFLCLVLMVIPKANAATTTNGEVFTHVVYRDFEKGLSFRYTVNNGEATVVSYSFFNLLDDTLDCLSIPDTMGGYPVTAIGERAFANDLEIWGVSIPNSVTTIGAEAFSGCEMLDSFTIPDSVVTIGNGAFYNCSGIMFITIPTSVTVIGDNAFSGCDFMETFYEGTQDQWNQVKIGSGNDSLLQYLLLEGGNVEPEEPVEPDTTLYTYTVTDGEATITECDGHASGDIVIPSNLGGYPVTAIGAHAFSECDAIETVVIPDTVITIGDYAFAYCQGIKTVEIGAGVMYIGDFAFDECKSLSEVIYNGTKEQWNEININDNEYLLNATIHCLPSGNQILTQPAAVTTQAGTVARFAVEACGDVQSYVWQYNRGSGWYFTYMDGCNTSTLNVTAAGSRNGYSYRCTVTFADGTKITSEAAELTVKTAITIQKQPEDQGAVSGGKAVFSVTAAGEGLLYQWQYNADGQWTDVSGANARTLAVKDAVDNRAWQYRCKITDITGLVAYTDVVALRILSVAQQPETTTALLNKNATFTVVLDDTTGAMFCWQYQRPGSKTWHNTAMEGCNTATLKVIATQNREGYRYRCVITDAENGKLITEAATLYVDYRVRITAWNDSVTARPGKKAQVSISAVNAVSYQWQYQRPGSEKWFNTNMEGCNTATLLVNATVFRNGYKYRCVVKGADGTKVISSVTTLTVK